MIQESKGESAYGIYIGAKNMLLFLPGLVLIILVGHGNKVLSAILAVCLLLFFGFAKAAYYKYKDVSPLTQKMEHEIDKR